MLKLKKISSANLTILTVSAACTTFTEGIILILFASITVISVVVGLVLLYKFVSQSGKVELLSTNDPHEKLKFKTERFDENRRTFAYIKDQKIFEGMIKNGQVYSLEEEKLKEASQLDKAKIRFVQYEEDQEDNEIITFKQVNLAN